jgi:alanyl-tRNA synthetase
VLNLSYPHRESDHWLENGKVLSQLEFKFLTQRTYRLAYAVVRKRVCITANRLYLTDSHLVEFTTRVSRQWEKSGRNLITLSDTAFYPTSGGQPHDTGTIDGVDVLDVYEEDCEIVHVVERPIERSNNVFCEVDWTRRHDHMQQHTGQHILSQALLEVCDTPTVGFTIGPDWSTIVLETKPEPKSLDSALRLANTIIDEDRPVNVLLPSIDELEEMPIRGILPDKETIRVVRVERFDWSPCGGTHCSTTSDVRLIVLLGIRKEKDTHRLEFVCGRRAEETVLRHASAIAEVAAMLDVGSAEVVERTRSLLEKAQSHESKIEELREARLYSDKERLQASVRDSRTGIIATVLDGRTVQEVRQLAHLLVEEPNTVAFLVGREQDKVGLAFARSIDRHEDMNHVMRHVCDETGCRGGGNPVFASGGGGADLNAEKVLEVARRALSL